MLYIVKYTVAKLIHDMLCGIDRIDEKLKPLPWGLPSICCCLYHPPQEIEGENGVVSAIITLDKVGNSITVPCMTSDTSLSLPSLSESNDHCTCICFSSSIHNMGSARLWYSSPRAARSHSTNSFNKLARLFTSSVD